ncbi:MAG: type II secretion system protein M [Gammaproteobacteria bacterium]|nr:type II secretion system protein M [Gammaproteobacteria bacterium]MDH5303073.1 type II secretion system protein M [Gammaproteobacteria bacterium]MDH5322889.1 type II secretion system protein M [Gammaproteobacteria bacterium]
MKDWFEALQKREQIFISAGGIIVLLTLIYAFIWFPLDAGQNALSASVSRWEQSLVALKPLKNIQVTTSTSRAASTGSGQQTPVVIVDQTLRARGLDRALQRSQPTSGNGIRVEFENVAFDELVQWLGDLSRQYGMHVTSGTMSTNTQASPGRINATFTLERA